MSAGWPVVGNSLRSGAGSLHVKSFTSVDTIRGHYRLVNSAASRAYYAMFQAAQIALEAGGLVRSEWSHNALHASCNQGLIQRRKLYPRVLRDYLTAALTVRQAADCGESGVSAEVAQRQVNRATVFLYTVEEVIGRRASTQR